MQQLSRSRSALAPLMAVAAVAAIACWFGGIATASAAETPRTTSCPAGYDLRTVSSFGDFADPYILPVLVDGSGNQDGWVCVLALPDAVRDAYCRIYGPGSPPCELRDRELPIYHFKDNDNPAGA
jgi:hypothetical protein